MNTPASGRQADSPRATERRCPLNSAPRRVTILIDGTAGRSPTRPALVSCGVLPVPPGQAHPARKYTLMQPCDFEYTYPVWVIVTRDAIMTGPDHLVVGFGPEVWFDSIEADGEILLAVLTDFDLSERRLVDQGLASRVGISLPTPIAPFPQEQIALIISPPRTARDARGASPALATSPLGHSVVV
jgi:hypothetical protein